MGCRGRAVWDAEAGQYGMQRQGSMGCRGRAVWDAEAG